MRRFAPCVAVLAFLCVTVRHALAAAPNPGDIAVIGIHADPDDRFAWVTLVDLAPGQVIYFSDAGWFGGGFGGGTTVSDGGIRLTVPAGGIPAGAVDLVNLESGPLPTGYERISSAALGPEMMAGNFGDQIVVFTGSDSSPTFLFAVTTNATQWSLSQPDPNFPAESELYPGLSEGETAVAVGAGATPGDEFDNARYVGISRGTLEELQAALADPDNWEATDTPIGDITNGTLVPGFEIIESGGFSRGDVNVDAMIDIGDAISALTYLFGTGFELTCVDAADVNDDGQTDISDPISLLAYLFADGTPPPAPFPGCGPDPTEDSLTCEEFSACQ